MGAIWRLPVYACTISDLTIATEPNTPDSRLRRPAASTISSTCLIAITSMLMLVCIKVRVSPVLGMISEKNHMDDRTIRARRDFLKKAGKFATYTPPAIMLLMYPSRDAISKSIKGNNGFGNGCCDGSPNGKSDRNR
jgi:hypothetical protein